MRDDMRTEEIDKHVLSKMVYVDKNVYEAALDRIRWLYDSFPNVGCNISGGKDSTVVMHLALEVARERGRLPLDVLFIDQENEWRAVVEYMRLVRAMPDVRLHWLQVPMRISNGTSSYDQWLQCWEPGAVWMREKEPDSIHDNVYGTPTFADLFLAWQKRQWPEGMSSLIAGVRTEESPSRKLGLTVYETWGGETWGRKGDGQRFTWYPIYDWRLQDVWHYIAVNDLPYCEIYDRMWQYGVPVHKMRVSSHHHESALNTLFLLQEIEPDTWEIMAERVAGVHSAMQLQWSAFRVNELPPMFRSWREYRDHLLQNLIVDDGQREKLRRQFYGYDRRFAHDRRAFDDLMRTQIKCLLVGDDHGVKLTVFEASHLGKSRNSGKISGRKIAKPA